MKLNVLLAFASLSTAAFASVLPYKRAASPTCTINLTPVDDTDIVGAPTQLAYGTAAYFFVL